MPEPDDKLPGRTPTLRVYVMRHCPFCREALSIVENVKVKFSALQVRVIHLDGKHAENVDGVFSVPTYVLDGRTLSLGNPDPDVLDRQLNETLSRARRRQE